MTVLQS